MAFIEFSSNRDFHRLHDEELEIADDMINHWQKALDHVSGFSYLTHNSEFRCETRIQRKCVTVWLLHSQSMRMNTWFLACSFDDKLVHEVQTYFLEKFRTISRPAVEHAVVLPGVMEDMKLQLLRCKVRHLSLCLQSLAITSQYGAYFLVLPVTSVTSTKELSEFSAVV